MGGTQAKATALLAVLQLTGGSLVAQKGVDSLIPPQPVGYVNDYARVLDSQSSAEMEDLIRRLQVATGAEIAVVTLPSIGDRDPREVALAIGRKWKVGAKAEIGDPRRNAGLVLLLVPRRPGDRNSGHIRIEVGQGLEGIVTDAAAGQVRDLMTPSLSAGQYGPGLLAGVRALTGRIAHGYGVTDTTLTALEPSTNNGGGSSLFSNLLPLLFFIVFILIASSLGRRRRRSGIYWGGPWIGGGWGGGGGFGGGGGGFGGFGGGGGFSGGGAGGRF